LWSARLVRGGEVFSEHTKWVAGVLLDTEDRELDCHVQGRVGDIGLLVTQTHRADEAYTMSVMVWRLGHA